MAGTETDERPRKKDNDSSSNAAASHAMPAVELLNNFPTPDYYEGEVPFDEKPADNKSSDKNPYDEKPADCKSSDQNPVSSSEIQGVKIPHLLPSSSRIRGSGTTSSTNSKKSSANIKGKVIDSNHVLYDLSVGMMLGLRFSIAKTAYEERKNGESIIFRLEDYMSVERYLFPFSWDTSDTTTPSTIAPENVSEAMHTFKFRAYAPFVFSKIRRTFGVEKSQFMNSVCGNSNFIEFMSNSNSGQFFFYSHDGKYMIKTQTYQEVKFLRKILPKYHQYILDNPNSFLTHYYGLYHVKIPHLGMNVPFVIMKSVFNTEKRIHNIYDLKGSTVGRKAKVGESVYKDLDIVEEGVKLNIGEAKKEMVLEQLEKDAKFLASLNIMDYSLLLGVHSRERERMKVREEEIDRRTTTDEAKAPDEKKSDTGCWQMTQPDQKDKAKQKIDLACLTDLAAIFIPGIRDDDDAELFESLSINDEFSVGLSSVDDMHSCGDDEYRPSNDSVCNLINDHNEDDLINDTDSDQSSVDVLEVTAATHDHVEVLWVTSVDGITERKDLGVESWLVDPGTMQSKEIYFLGVIDILQRYNTRKKAETIIRTSLSKDNVEEISCVDPDMYALRFIKFCSMVME